MELLEPLHLTAGESRSSVLETESAAAREMSCLLEDRLDVGESRSHLYRFAARGDAPESTRVVERNVIHGAIRELLSRRRIQ